MRDENLDRMIRQVKEFIKEEESLPESMPEKQNGDLTSEVMSQKGNERPSEQ